MDGVMLLSLARAAGLTVLADSDRLVVRGPTSCERLALELLERKAELLPLVSACGPSQVALDHAATLRDAWRRACFELGETAGWPELPFKPGTSVAPGAALWRLWMTRASVPDMVMVIGALQDLLSQYARDGE